MNSNTGPTRSLLAFHSWEGQLTGEYSLLGVWSRYRPAALSQGIKWATRKSVTTIWEEWLKVYYAAPSYIWHLYTMRATVRSAAAKSRLGFEAKSANRQKEIIYVKPWQPKRKCNAEAIVQSDAASRRLNGGEKHKVIDWFPDGKLTAITLFCNSQGLMSDGSELTTREQNLQEQIPVESR
jgi:hypothetical protein